MNGSSLSVARLAIIASVRELFELEFMDGERVRIDVSALNAALDRIEAPVVGSLVTDALWRQIERNGIEPDHLAKLGNGEPDFRPATLIVRNGSAHMVDGNHRAALWLAAGSTVIPVRVAQEPLWRQYALSLAEA